VTNALGKILFAVSFAGLGILSLVSGDFALNWQPVPTWVPWREPLAWASGAMLLAGGLGLLYRRTATAAALLLTANMLVWLLLLRLPRVIASPANEGRWLGLGETATLVCGGWILLAVFAGSDQSFLTRFTGSRDAVSAAQLLFGAALIPIGISHIVYVQQTAALVPAWLPNRAAVADLTGAAQIAAGLGVLFGVLPRLAATLEAILLGLFTTLVWLPRIVATPTDRLPATAFLVSAATTGAACVVAGSLAGVRWGRVQARR